MSQERAKGLALFFLFNYELTKSVAVYLSVFRICVLLVTNERLDSL